MTQVTFTIEVSDTVAEELAEMPDKDELLVDAVSEAVAIGIWKRGIREAGKDARIFPPPGFAKAERLMREARGDMRTSAEIVREGR